MIPDDARDPRSSSTAALGVVRRGRGPGLALAHGAGGGVLANFATLIDRLSPTRSLVGIDYPGSGGVPARGALSLDDLADDLVAATVAAGHDRFPVVGISLGAADVDIAETAGSLRVPAEVYVSGQDRIVLPASTRRLAHLIDGATVVEYPAAGHIYTEAEAGDWAADVALFLRRHGL